MYPHTPIHFNSETNPAGNSTHEGIREKSERKEGREKSAQLMWILSQNFARQMHHQTDLPFGIEREKLNSTGSYVRICVLWKTSESSYKEYKEYYCFNVFQVVLFHFFILPRTYTTNISSPNCSYHIPGTSPCTFVDADKGRRILHKCIWNRERMKRNMEAPYTTILHHWFW